jgi:hypothetical protein
MQGLQMLQCGANAFAEADMPHGAAALEKIQQGIQELEARVQESIAHQQLQPLGGPLQQVQVCSAAGNEDPPEWSMGQLYISSETLLFESSEMPPWHVGPVAWSSIASLEKLHGSGDIRLRLAEGLPSHLFSGLNNLEVLEKFGGLRDEDPPIFHTATSHEIAVGAGVNDAPSNQLTPAAEASEGPDRPSSNPLPVASCGNSCSAGSTGAALEQTPNEWLESFNAGGHSFAAQAPPEFSILTAPETSFVPTDSFAVAADALPEGHSDRSSPVFQERLPKATLKMLKKFLSVDQDWPLRMYMEENLKIFDVEESRWAVSNRIPGTRMRRMRFKMPVPSDVPAAVKKIISLPPWTTATHLSRLGYSEDQIVLVQDVHTHDVTFGSNFYVQDVLVFQNDPDGGVILTKYIEVRWVTALPWYAGPLSAFIEMKAKQDGQAAGAFLVQYVAKYLEDEAGLRTS